MSTHLQATGYVLDASGAPVPTSVDETIFDYPTVSSVVVTPATGTADTSFAVTVIGTVDPAAGPAAMAYRVDGGGWVIGALIMAAGTHEVHGRVMDAHGAYMVSDPVDVTVTPTLPPPPPPPPTGMVIGTTPGPLGTAKAIAALPGCQVLRSYAPAATKVAADSELAYCVAHGVEIWYSFAAMPTQALFQACVADWMKTGKPFWWTYVNEVDGKMPPAQFKSQYDTLQRWAEAVPGYAASKVRDQTSFKSYMLVPSHPEGDPNLYVPTRPTRLGFDIYVLAQIPMVIAFCKAHGNVPWALLEHGCGGAGGEKVPGLTQAQYDADRDGSAVKWNVAAETAWKDYPPKGRCWYASTQGGNARSDTLVALPKVAAHLAAQIHP